MAKSLKLDIITLAILKGGLATFILLVMYFTIISLVSGWSFAQNQFSKYWYFIISLSIGFGIQFGLYNYLKTTIQKNVSAKVVATSGVTSTVVMISCCAHYLVNILPIIGIVGVVTIISEYQVELFWVGLAFNIAGILYMLNRLVKYTQLAQKQSS